MCNILIMKPGQMPIRDEFDNMVYNNWHSYGLVTKIDGKLDIKKSVPKSGENNPDEIYKLLERDVEFERILHVRHTTAGLTNLENCHPFDVYYNQKSGRQVVFMHNGTMYEYKSKKPGQYGHPVDDDDGPSDTANFVDQVLTPFLARFDVGTGAGEIQDKMIQMIIKKFWPGNNRGILISSNQDDFILGDWKKIKDTDGKEILSSNDDYFTTVKRGPEFNRREEARKALASKNALTVVKSEGGRVVEPLSNFRIGYKHGFYSLEGTLKNINQDWNVYDRECATAIGYATAEELAEMIKLEDRELIYILDWIFGDYAALYEEYKELEEKHHRSTQMIASLKQSKGG